MFPLCPTTPFSSPKFLLLSEVLLQPVIQVNRGGKIAIGGCFSWEEKKRMAQV